MLQRSNKATRRSLARERNRVGPLAGHRSPLRTRRAFSLVEVCVAVILLAMVLSLSVKGFAALSASQRRTEQRGRAVQTAASVFEQATAGDPTELDGAIAQLMAGSTQVRQTLPEGRLTIDVGEATAAGETLAARRITVVIEWNDRSGMPVAPVRLSTWVHPGATVAETLAEQPLAETEP